MGTIRQANDGFGGRPAGLAAAREWAARRTYASVRFPAERLAALKGGTSVSVVIPAKSLATTIGGVVAPCVELRERGIVDEVIVIDAAVSGDGSAAAAEHAGATVFQEDALLPQLGPALGKGDALWRSLTAATGDVIVFVDGDTQGFDAGFVRGLAGPLLEDDGLRLVKGAYRRPFTGDNGLRVADGGGRVSELAARPLLNIFFPELAALQQPLAGEFAARRETLEQMPFATGYGCEIQLLIDYYRRFGLDAIAQCDLGERVNPHQPLHDLGAMAHTVMRVLLSRAGHLELDGEQYAEFLNYAEGEPRLRPAPLAERPPLASLSERAGAARGA